MSSHNLNGSRKFLAVCCGVGLAAGIFAFRAKADEWDKKTVLTVNKTIQVQDRILPAGTYVFKLLDSSSNRHVVQIFDQDQRHIIDTILAIPNYRLQPTGHSRFLFYETPPGAAPALHAWFYPGDNFGQEFRYPKHLAMLETVQQTEGTRMMQRETESTESATKEEPAPAPPPQTTTEEQAVTTPPSQPVEVAQNNEPPAPPAPEAQPAPPPAETPQQLPHTASPYPLVGLGGIFSLGLAGLLRLKRLA
jgi:hypothetical protein